ncbi:MAG: trigger factor [Clostridia bacterium]|nr:trigger factor [Clostridia bacterium]
MKYVFDKGEHSTVKITITLTNGEWKDAQEAAYQKNKGRYSLPGFRKGHVPKAMLMQAYGPAVFYEDGVNEAFVKYYYDVLEKEKDNIEPIDRPEVSIDSINEKGLKFTAVVPVKPEVKIGAYKGIKIEKVEYNVKDEDVENEVNRLLSQHSTEEAVEGRAAKSGDITTIDYSGAIGGVKFDGGTAEKQRLVLGSNTFIPGFEDQVVGMNIGETKDITVKFPDDYGATELAGKEAVFTVTLHELKEKKLPELTDEFVKDKTGDETVDAYKATVRERLEKANAERAERELEDKIIKKVADDSEVEIPEVLVEKEIDRMVQDVTYRLMYQGLNFKDYLKYTNQTEQAYRDGCKDAAKDHVKTQLVIDKIIVDEKLEATDEEINERIAKQAEAAKKPVEEYKKDIDAQRRSYIENSIVIDKLFKFLKENNKIG